MPHTTIRIPKGIYEEAKKRKRSDPRDLTTFHHAAVIYTGMFEKFSGFGNNKKEVKKDKTFRLLG